jgi:hypothetical protein
MSCDTLQVPCPLDLLAFDRVLPFIDDARTFYVSQPVFTGGDVTILVTSSGTEVESTTDHALETAYLSRMCACHSTKLRRLADKIFRTIGGDTIRLDGILFRLNPERSGFIDIYRIVVFDGDTHLLELPYQETIFVEDGARVPRFVMPIAANTALHGLDLARDATSALIKTNIMDDEEPVRFKGLIWIPLQRERYRPSFFVPYEEDRCSEEDACNWMRKVHRRDFRDLCYVDCLRGIEWT